MPAATSTVKKTHSLGSKASIKHSFPLDKSFFAIIATFLLLGIIMIYNSTVIYSVDTYGESNRLIVRHISWVLVGLVCFSFFLKFNYKNLPKVIYVFLIATLLSLGLLAFLGLVRKLGVDCTNTFIFAPCVNGANRWIYFNPPPLPKIPLVGILGFQPSELAKITVILYLAIKLSKAKEASKKNSLESFMIYLIATGLIAFLVVLEPNMSTAVLIFMIGTIMYFAAGFQLWPLFISIPIMGAVAAGFMLSSDYRRERLVTFLSGHTQASQLESGYHIKQILIALGSGGLFGLGIGQSRQKFQYLPEVATDSIFAVIGEELGFIGTTLVICLVAFFVYKGLVIAKNAPDAFGKLLAVGITAWLGLQFFVNIAAMTKLIPLTGIPMPLISYGGSSTVFSLMGLGILANISSQSYAKA